MPSIELFRMLGSGTEAVMGAIRLAGFYTGRKWIIKIGGAYHGWSDQMVYGLRIPGTGRREGQGIRAFDGLCSGVDSLTIWTRCAGSSG